MKRLARHLYRALFSGLFAAAGTALRLVQRPGAYDSLAVERILVLRFGLLGDAAQLTPTLRLLRASFPRARIDVVAPPIQAEVLRGQPFLDGVIRWTAGDLAEPRHALRPSAWREAAGSIRRLRADRYDVALSCYGALGSAVALLSGAPHRFGFAGEALPGTLNHPLPGRRWEEPQHEAEYGLAVARAAGATGDSPATLLVPGDEACAAAGRLLPRRARAPLVVLHAGATNGDAKRWPPPYWVELTRRLVVDGNDVALVGGPGEAALSARIARAAGTPVTNLAGRTTIPELLAVLERADLVISGDSGPLHLAVAVQTPTVAIHGPTAPGVNGPYKAHTSAIVRHALPCSPCYRLDRVADCPLGHTLCQWLVTPDEVDAAAERLLDGFDGDGTRHSPSP